MPSTPVVYHIPSAGRADRLTTGISTRGTTSLGACCMCSEWQLRVSGCSKAEWQQNMDKHGRADKGRALLGQVDYSPLATAHLTRWLLAGHPEAHSKLFVRQQGGGI